MAQVTMQVAVPDGVAPGGLFNVTTPDGQILQLTCPDGVGPGSPIQFAYVPKEEGETKPNDFVHPDDVKLMEEAMVLADAKQQELIAAGVVAAQPLPDTSGWTGNVFPPALFAVGNPAKVTRSDGSQTGCTIAEVFLTALGPQYNVYLGQGGGGEPIYKCCGEADLDVWTS
mmetsp:Transcript_15387/g.30324  ORF Transcript_15387/g.30324 Transcript_15387/m.30324 type:complete len:171 (-) Transcript_15387:156-668(-)|eukprot:CAMPEP_0172678208 /NCGR_PEP_ID=MMETSP1074-20121228/15229_1 /TAXON_ID=2916 /ORGANISM="Ceratium fusus, Strain PA161109" /LENGTH=170 /DNA_ID=CAMNT_0013496187 /DNA_START=59 /DNA_END=571 /DNA_ORIENTATION=-